LARGPEGPLIHVVRVISTVVHPYRWTMLRNFVHLVGVQCYVTLSTPNHGQCYVTLSIYRGECIMVKVTVKVLVKICYTLELTKSRVLRTLTDESSDSHIVG
jgi:hypothetical protein